MTGDLTSASEGCQSICATQIDVYFTNTQRDQDCAPKDAKKR